MIVWNNPPVPRFVVQMLVFDNAGNTFVYHRSNKVRSARDVWSIPTGLCEIGQTAEENILRELKEEFDLVPISIQLIGNYDNIAGDTKSYCQTCDVATGEEHLCHLKDSEVVQPTPKQYHWVMGVYAVQVDKVSALVNKEPDKHDQVSIIHIDQILDASFYFKYPMHNTLTQWLRQNSEIIHSFITQTIEPIYSVVNYCLNEDN